MTDEDDFGPHDDMEGMTFGIRLAVTALLVVVVVVVGLVAVTIWAVTR